MSTDIKSTHQIKDLPEMGKVVEIRLAQEELDRLIKQEVGRYAKKVHTKGFRPGKTPLEIVARQYGGEIEERVRERLVNDRFQQALQEHKLYPEGQIDSRIKQAPGKKHAGIYEISFEVLPEFEADSIKDLKCSLVKSAVAQSDIDSALNDLCRQHTKWVEIELASALGHQVSFAYTMVVDGKPIQAPGQDKMHMDIVVGEKHILEDLSAQLQGVRAGEHKRVETRFPDSFASPDLAGKPVVFEIDIEKVSSPEVPEIDDEFADQLNHNKGGKAGLIESISQYLSQEAGRLAHMINRHRVQQLMLENFQLPLPPKRMKQHTQARLAQLKESKPRPGAPPANINPDEVESQVRKDMILGVIFSELARHYRCRPSAERVAELVNADARMTKNPRATYKKIMKSSSERQQYENIVIEEMVIEHIIKAVDGDYEELNLDQLRQQSQSPLETPSA